MCALVITTPLGAPVLPEVYMTIAMSRPDTGCSGSGPEVISMSFQATRRRSAGTVLSSCVAPGSTTTQSIFSSTCAEAVASAGSSSCATTRQRGVESTSM